MGEVIGHWSLSRWFCGEKMVYLGILNYKYLNTGLPHRFC